MKCNNFVCVDFQGEVGRRGMMGSPGDTGNNVSALGYFVFSLKGAAF